MADVALDANVLVAWLDAADALHGKAKDLLDRLRAAGDAPLFLDVCVGEAVSVTCRRARERKTRAPDLEAFLDLVGQLHERGEITFVAGVLETRRLRRAGRRPRDWRRAQRQRCAARRSAARRRHR